MARLLVAANSIWNIRNFRHGLIREFIGNGHEVITVTPDRTGIEAGPTQVRHRTCAMERSGVNPLKDLALLYRLVRIIRDERPDLFISFTIKPNIYGAVASRICAVPAVPNVSGLGTSFLGSRTFRKLILGMYRLAFARAARVFFQNPDDRALFVKERIVLDNQAVTLPGSGIDLSFFSAAEVPTELRFLMIGRLLRDKGVREFFEAARAVKEKLPRASFYLLGELDADNPTAIQTGELETWLKEGAVRYLGSTEDVRPFIRNSAVVVLPSYREGLPRTLLEAAAMGRPLIATDVPGCRELVRDGETGFLCEAKNAASLAAAMERFANTSYDVRAMMGAAARIMAEREFDEGLVLRAYCETVRELMP